MSTVVASARSGAWLASPGRGVYVHIPFCMHRCHYCDFNTYEGLDALHEPYVDALVKVIETSSVEVPEVTSLRSVEVPEVTSIFFGGGTPTLLPPQQLGRVLAALRNLYPVAPDAEITVEANPETVDERAFEGLLDAGFNRFSIGVQSLDAHVLERLGRTHSPASALKAVAAARSAGVTDLSTDLIYGSPWESASQWERTLAGIVDADPDHVSAYALTIESGTPLGTLVSTGRVPNVDPDVQAERFEAAAEVLGRAGFHRYEVSNWSKPQRASRHNVLYWSAGDYLGFGAGAHGHSSGRRYWSTRLPREFIDRVHGGLSTEAGSEDLSRPERSAEAIMLGLRLVSGVDERAFSARFGPHLQERSRDIENLISKGLLERRAGWLRVAPAGSFRADGVIAQLF